MKSSLTWRPKRGFILSGVLFIGLCVATFVGLQRLDFFTSGLVSDRSQETQAYRPATDCPEGGCAQPSRQGPNPGVTPSLPPFLQMLQQNKSGVGEGSRSNQGGTPATFASPEERGGTAAPMLTKKSEEAKAAVYNGFPTQSQAAPQYRFRPFVDEDVPTTEAPPGKLDLLTEARTQYWNGDLEAAVKAYNELIRYYPNEPDFPGELGNIYYQQGKQDLAAQAYYKAALLLLQQREYERAERLYEVLNALNKKLADELERQLRKS